MEPTHGKSGKRSSMRNGKRENTFYDNRGKEGGTGKLKDDTTKLKKEVETKKEGENIRRERSIHQHERRNKNNL